jgi:hypothetical protein
MANGFFLGGVAQGVNARDQIDIKNRELDIKDEALAGSQQRQLATELEKTIAGNVQTITGIIQESRKAGASPAQIKATIAPLVQSFQQLAQRTGRDISVPMQQFDALINIPAGAESAPEPKTEVAKTRADARAGFITPEEASARINRLTREEGAVNTVEIIRRKLASGQQLSPGEQKVYDDATRFDLLGSIIRGQGGVPAIPVPPLPGAK